MPGVTECWTVAALREDGASRGTPCPVRWFCPPSLGPETRPLLTLSSWGESGCSRHRLSDHFIAGKTEVKGKEGCFPWTAELCSERQPCLGHSR